jgi:hypothetical protein
LAIRPITVPDLSPERNAFICAKISPAARPASRGTGDSTFGPSGWQPEQADAPGGAGEAACAAPAIARISTAATAARVDIMRRPPYSLGGASPTRRPIRTAHTMRMFWFLSGKLRMRFPVAAKMALSTDGAATQMVGSPTPPQNPPDGMTIDSTFGISAMRIEL